MDLYLIDGNSYVYRAFYAIKGLTTSTGVPTNAIYGFTTMLLKIIREKKPEGLAVFFDRPEPTERHRLFETYKAHRPETPHELSAQLPHIRRITSAFRIPVFEIPGYEADDLIGTVAKKEADRGARVFIVTGDKDLLQLVDDNIKVYDPMKERVLDAAYVKEKYGVGPERVTEFMALTGDPVDNIPGIKGVGEKTAKDLMLLYGSLEDMFLHPELIKKEKLRSLVSSSKEIVLLSRQLATIDTAVPMEADPAEFELKEPDWLALLQLFKEFEFTRLMQLIPAARGTARACETVTTEERLLEIVSSLGEEVAFDMESTGRDPRTSETVGIALCADAAEAYYVPIGHSYSALQKGDQIDRAVALGRLRPIFEGERIAKIGHNLKYDITLLEREGLHVAGRMYDTMIASYLLNPNKSTHGLDETAFEYLSKRKRSFAEVLGKRQTFAEVPIEEATPYAAEDAALSLELKKVLFDRLDEEGLTELYATVEMPLVPVLVAMEQAGVRVDTALLRGMSAEMETEIESIRKRIFFLAGQEFNINSPKQLSSVLFRDLGLTPSKRTKTGFSTGMDVLEELAEVHELPKEILQFRSLTKLKTTYLDVLPGLVDQRTGRVHTSFNQTMTATGRLSSSDPNLQNIPIKGEWGRRIREAFIAEEGNLLLSADYSQVELRILAHLSADEGLREAFRAGTDIHARTASELYDVPAERVTPDMRRTAKTVIFGIIYGISAFGLSEALNIKREDAQKFIDQYFARHQGVKRYIDTTIAEARERGYTTTLMGRKRPVPELNSTNRTVRQQGERLAVNSPIQGAAADMIKVAMVNISRRLTAEGAEATMILQVHDELLFEARESEAERAESIVREEMEAAIGLSVPLKVEIGSGRNWAEAH